MRGRPNTYRPSIAKKLPDMFAEGKSVCEVSVELGISKETFYDWTRKYPEFSDAYKAGRALSQAWWERLGRAGAIGKVPIQAATWIYNMKNRFHDDWSDKQEIEHSGTVEVALLTPDERKARIAELLVKAQE